MIISLSAFIFDHNRERTMSRRPFHSLAEAQAWAAERVGPTPELGTNYAVSGDGVVTLYWAGTTAAELFPALAQADDDGAIAEVQA